MKRPRLEIGPALQGDDAALRGLLAGEAMEGAIKLCMQREPRFEAALDLEGEHRTLVARNGERIVGCASLSWRRLWLGGKAQQVGYLSGLRREAGHRSRNALDRGFEQLRFLADEAELATTFCAVLAYNQAARRSLERRRPGWPEFRPVDRMSTLVWRTRRYRELQSRGWAPWDFEQLAAHDRQFDLRPCWNESSIDALEPAPIYLGGIALWDQRSIKQNVITGYAPWLARLRPWLNLGLPVVGQPSLPKPGSTLSMAFLSHLDRNEPGPVFEAIAGASALAFRRGVELLSLGLRHDDPLTNGLARRLAARRLESVVYEVVWPGSTERIDGPCWPEVALL